MTYTEHYIEHGDAALFARVDGAQDADAPTVVFANSLGTNLHLWDAVLPLLPEGLRIVRMDKRGHGKSTATPAPYSMGKLVKDTEAVCDALNVRDAMFVGLSIGGMIGQGLAVKRFDIIRTLVLSNTAARIGTPKLWQDRIDAVRAHGIESFVDGIMRKWFTRDFAKSDAVKPWRDMVCATSIEGYCGCCAAVSGTDFYTPTSGLRIPTLGIAGSDDGSTPADLVRETVDVVPGSQFHIIRKSGHLPCVEQPHAYTERLIQFMKDTGHI